MWLPPGDDGRRSRKGTFHLKLTNLKTSSMGSPEMASIAHCKEGQQRQPHALPLPPPSWWAAQGGERSQHLAEEMATGLLS